MLILQNEIGQTIAWNISNSDGCPIVNLMEIGGWPYTEPSFPFTPDAVRQFVTRISVRYSGGITVSSVKCCAKAGDAGTCADIE
jgi:hypothetical protein